MLNLNTDIENWNLKLIGCIYNCQIGILKNAMKLVLMPLLYVFSHSIQVSRHYREKEGKNLNLFRKKNQESATASLHVKVGFLMTSVVKSRIFRMSFP